MGIMIYSHSIGIFRCVLLDSLSIFLALLQRRFRRFDFQPTVMKITATRVAWCCTILRVVMSRGGLAVRVPSMLATMPPTRVRSSA